MKARFQLRPGDHLADPMAKQAFNRALFAEVAPKYDFITKALSFGRDGAWKRRLLKALPDHQAPVCLDLACGTGDLTRLLVARYPHGRVTGLDLTPDMLDIARERSTHLNLTFIEGTMNILPLDDASVDVVTGGYALRNAPDFERALQEIRRVLRPGGTAAFLDFSKPPSRLGQAVTHFALKTWGGLWGFLLHGNPDVYGYIGDSLRLFPDRAALRMRFAAHGFVLRGRRRFFGGLLENVIFEKRGEGSRHVS